MSTQEMIKKKYRLSLFYLLKDLLIAMIVGGVVFLSLATILVYVVGDSEFVFSEYITDAFAYFIVGMIIGLIFRCLSRGEDDNMGEVAGVTLYNTYAGIHNTFLFSNAGSDYSYGAAASIIGIFITVLGFIYRVACTAFVVPVSLVYLCIMSIFEAIFRGIPEGLGNFLDKLIPLFSKVGGMIVVVLVIFAMNK